MYLMWVLLVTFAVLSTRGRDKWHPRFAFFCLATMLSLILRTLRHDRHAALTEVRSGESPSSDTLAMTLQEATRTGRHDSFASTSEVDPAG